MQLGTNLNFLYASAILYFFLTFSLLCSYFVDCLWICTKRHCVYASFTYKLTKHVQTLCSSAYQTVNLSIRNKLLEEANGSYRRIQLANIFRGKRLHSDSVPQKIGNILKSVQ